MNKCRVLEGLFLLQLAIMMLLLPIRWILASLLAAFVHEMGHYIAVVLCDGSVRNVRVGLWGTVIETAPMLPWRGMICSIAGPIAGFMMIFFSKWLPVTAACAVIQSVYNLIPVFPLDGGRILQNLCQIAGIDESCRLIFEYIVLVSIGVLIVYLYFRYRISVLYLLLFAVLLCIRDQIKRPCKP